MSYPILLSAPASSSDAAAAVDNQPYPSLWIGRDGSQWDLTRIDGPILVQNGVIGLHDPKFERALSSNPVTPGHRVRSVRALARDVFWPLLFRADSIPDWVATYSGFFTSIHPFEEGTWRVGTGLDTRELRLTGIYDSNQAFRHDPFTLGWATIGVQLEAAHPYWEGRPVTRGPWKAADPQPFFPGPPFTISSAAAFGSATIPNPGNVETFLTWRVEGPLDDIELGIDGHVIDVPFPVPDGAVLEIDTDPRSQFATMGGDVTEQLGFQEFAPVQPGAAVPLHVSATGTGQVSASLIPLYFRAFG